MTEQEISQRAVELAQTVTMPEVCEIILILCDRVEKLEKRLAKMSKKKDKPKLKPSKTVNYICNDALYYQNEIIANHHDKMQVTRKPEGYMEVAVENCDVPPRIYQVNEVTWKMWVKEVRVVKSPIQPEE